MQIGYWWGMNFYFDHYVADSLQPCNALYVWTQCGIFKHHNRKLWQHPVKTSTPITPIPPMTPINPTPIISKTCTTLITPITPMTPITCNHNIVIFVLLGHECNLTGLHLFLLIQMFKNAGKKTIFTISTKNKSFSIRIKNQIVFIIYLTWQYHKNVK